MEQLTSMAGTGRVPSMHYGKYEYDFLTFPGLDKYLKKKIWKNICAFQTIVSILFLKI